MNLVSELTSSPAAMAGPARALESMSHPSGAGLGLGGLKLL